MTFEKINYHSLTTFWGQHQKTLRNTVVVLLSIYLLAFLARLIWQLVPAPANTAPPSQQTAVIGVGSAAKGGVNLAQIQQLNLFGKPNQAPTAPVQQEVTDAPQTKLNLILTGVVASSVVDNATAIIEHKGTQMVYGLGEKIDGTNAILKQVQADRVIIKNGAQHETLMLDGLDYEESGDAGRMASNRRGRTLQNSGAQRQIASNNPSTRLNEEAAEATNALREQPGDFTDFISISPQTADGQLVGYQVKPGKNPALFDSAGLQPGDIIIQINGLDLTDTQQSMEAMNALRSAQSIELTLTRDGEYQTVYLDMPAPGEE
ncbi:type II secretion system protein GspC [Salinimonas marina]|uniref:Type II secretion system protein GspC n=1 Tax=Salinimonas marina TaxID=2785918 RepID=A0A7S9HCV9_9ALTE|nr:type II secretion system protein GspC [Salinimonas marina]QPG05570.1 type II secretion system protein GspC [Salinimonas marina]